MQLLRTLRPVLHPRANATNRQPTTKIPTYNNVYSLFMRRTDFTVGSAFPPIVLLAVSTPTAPRSFQDLLHQQQPRQGSLEFSALFSSRWTLWVALHLPATAAIPHPISTLLLRSYRHLNHSPGPLISPFLHIIILAHYLTHSPGAMHTALTLIAQIQYHMIGLSIYYNFLPLLLFSRRFYGGTRTLRSLFAPLPIHVLSTHSRLKSSRLGHLEPFCCCLC